MGPARTAVTAMTDTSMAIVATLILTLGKSPASTGEPNPTRHGEVTLRIHAPGGVVPGGLTAGDHVRICLETDQRDAVHVGTAFVEEGSLRAAPTVPRRDGDWILWRIAFAADASTTVRCHVFVSTAPDPAAIATSTIEIQVGTDPENLRPIVLAASAGFVATTELEVEAP